MKIKKHLITAILLLGLSSVVSIVIGQEKEDTDRSLTYLALGDSYTIGESVEVDEQWPKQLRRALDSLGMKVQEPKIIAKTGWRTDDMLNAAKVEVGASQYDMVSLLIGVNNEYQGRSPKSFVDEFEKCLKFAIDHCKTGLKGVFVLSIPDYGYTPFGAENQKQISARLDAYNKICRKICKKYDVLYINITDISREVPEDDSLVAKDQLHPSGEQYSMWVERALDRVRKLYVG